MNDLHEALGSTPLHHASRKNSQKMVDRLIESKAPLNALDYDGNTPLLAGMIAGSNDIINVFIKTGANLSISNNKQQSACYFLAALGDIDILESVIEQKLNWNTPDHTGSTPIQIAAEVGNLECFDILVSKMGGGVSVINNDGESLAHILVRNDNAPLLTPLHNVGGSFDLSNKCGVRPIHLASGMAKIGALETLLQFVPDVMLEDSFGDFPIHYAARAGYINCIDLLLQKSADINAKGKSGKTVLHLATENQNIN
jgi:ankyrin repeat protein